MLRSDRLRTIRTALEEDAAFGDVTTMALFSSPIRAQATVVAHQPMTLAGIAVACEVFTEVDPSLIVTRARLDGQVVKSGAAVLTVEGDGRSLLIAERVALNFLQHLSGVATLTARFCHAVRGYPTQIVDTRKTTPGLRSLEKWAVRLGGGRNHRLSLADGILIKDNHLGLWRAQLGSVTQACRAAREGAPHGLRIIVEAQTSAEVRDALEGKADVILLDNMTPSQVRDVMAIIKDRALVEVSGGMTVEKAREMAAMGVHYISVGALTHSAPAADLSLDIVPSKRGRRRKKS